MLLSAYNKFIFSIFSERKDYLILTIYALKFGKSFISFLQIHYTRIDSSGKYLPSYEFNTRLKVIDSTDWDINFSKGRIIFKEDTVKIEFSFDMVMLYLNYTWAKQTSNPLNALGKTNAQNNPVVWNSFDFESVVRGSFITPNTSAEFINSVGNIDLVKSKKIQLGINGLLWSRLHDKEIDLAYSFILNKSRKSDSRLFLLHDKRVIQFSDIEYHIIKEKVSRRSSVKYPDNIVVTARNDEYQVSVNIHDHSEVIINEMVNNVDFFGKIFSLLINRLSGNPKELKMLAKADVVINNNMAQTEYSGIASVSNYVSYTR
jgi:hypothetical protein